MTAFPRSGRSVRARPWLILGMVVVTSMAGVHQVSDSAGNYKFVDLPAGTALRSRAAASRSAGL